MAFQICDVLGNFATFKTLPNMLVIAIQYFDHKGFKELVHVFVAICVLGSMDNSTVVVADFLAVVIVAFLIPGVLLHVHRGIDCVGGVGGVGGKSHRFAFDWSNLKVDM